MVLGIDEPFFRPEKLGRQNRQSQGNDNESGAGEYDHRNPDQHHGRADHEDHNSPPLDPEPDNEVTRRLSGFPCGVGFPSGRVLWFGARCYSPFHWGGRFCRKAEIPSWASCFTALAVIVHVACS